MYNQQYISKIIQRSPKEVEAFQQSVISGVGSLVYCEYLQMMHHQDKPTQRVFVPPISEVKRVLSSESGFLSKVRTGLIPYIADRIHDRPLAGDIGNFFRTSAEEDEVRSNILEAGAVLEGLILPRVSRYIPWAISTKLSLDNPDQQLFIEDKSIDMFGREPITDEMMQYVYEETFINLMIHAGMFTESRVNLGEDNEIGVSQVIKIDNPCALCPIYITTRIMELDSVMDLINFTTTSAILAPDDITTSKENTLSFLSLKE